MNAEQAAQCPDDIDGIVAEHSERGAYACHAQQSSQYQQSATQQSTYLSQLIINAKFRGKCLGAQEHAPLRSIDSGKFRRIIFAVSTCPFQAGVMGPEIMRELH